MNSGPVTPLDCGVRVIGPQRIPQQLCPLQGKPVCPGKKQRKYYVPIATHTFKPFGLNFFVGGNQLKEGRAQTHFDHDGGGVIWGGV